MELIRPFAEIGKGDAGLAGGKGASLGEMTQAGIPVPPGFVILADAFERFLSEADLSQELDAILDHVNREEMRSVDQASEKIKQLILSGAVPDDIALEIQKNFDTLGADYVAVRSSATAEDSSSAAWAGQLDTFLNTTETDLLENVKRCWASLFTPRAIFYRFEKGMHGQKISVAVVIQKMIQSEVSGIAFSVHPVTEDYNQMIIEAGYGLGEAIVSGQVTPDSFVVEKEPRRVIDINITTQNRALVRGKDGGNDWIDLTAEEGSKPSLSKEQVAELSEIVLRIEQHYGFPCDIEWAFEAGTFFITQSRPITTLSPKVAEVPVSQKPEDYYKTLRFHKKGRWSTYPLDTEVWHIAENGAAFEKTFGIWKEILAVCQFGEQYWNHMFVPLSFVEKLYARIREIETSEHKGIQKMLEKFYDEKALIRKEVPGMLPKDISKLSNDELADLFKKLRNRAHEIVVYDQFTWLGEEYWSPLMDKVLVEKYGLEKGSPEYTDALFALMKPREISTTLEEKREVIREVLAIQRGERTKEQAAVSLAQAFGWMPVLAFGTPWNEARYMQELDETMSRDEKALQMECDELSRYSELRDEAFEATAKKYAMAEEDTQVFVDYGLAIDARNEAEYVASFIGGYLMPIFDEIAKRLAISITELRCLLEAEVISCLKGQADAKSILATRTGIIAWGLTPDKTRITYTGEAGAEIFNYVEAQNSGAEKADGAARGITANRGKARGKIRRVASPEENDKVGPGDILVAYSTMVDNLPAMKKAAAFVTESGGLTCHAAVVAREFGVPCIVGYCGVMTDFEDGQMVEVDADKGIMSKI